MTWIEALHYQISHAVSEARQIVTDLRDCLRALRDGFTGEWDR